MISYSLCFVQLWVSVLLSIYYTEKHLGCRLGDTLRDVFVEYRKAGRRWVTRQVSGLFLYILGIYQIRNANTFFHYIGCLFYFLDGVIGSIKV